MKIGVLLNRDDILQGLPEDTIPQIASAGVDFVVVDMSADSKMAEIERLLREVGKNQLEAALIFSLAWRRKLAWLSPMLDVIQKYQIPRVFVRIYETLGPLPEDIAERLTKFLADVGFPIEICIYGALSSPNMPKTVLGQVFRGLRDRIGLDNLYFSPLLSWKTLNQPQTRGHKQVPGVFMGTCTPEELEATLLILGRDYDEAFLFPHTVVLGTIIKERVKVAAPPPPPKIWKMKCIQSTALRSSPSLGASIRGRLHEGDIIRLLEAPIEFDRQRFGRIGENLWVLIKNGFNGYLEEIE